MDDRDAEEVRNFLLQRAGCFAAHRVTTFKAYRNDKNSGTVQEITVEVRDAGPGTAHRYHARASDQFGRLAPGDARASLGDALMGVHWHELDKPRPERTDPEEIA